MLKSGLPALILVGALLAACNMTTGRSKAPIPLPAVVEAPRVAAGDCWSYSLKVSTPAEMPTAEARLNLAYAFCAGRVRNGRIEGWQTTQLFERPDEDDDGHPTVRPATGFYPDSLQILFKDDWSELDSGGAALVNRLDGLRFPLPKMPADASAGDTDSSQGLLRRVDDAQLAVAAGTFNVAHLQREAPDPNHRPTRIDVWYSPEIKRDVRTEIHFLDDDGKEIRRIRLDLLDFSAGHALTGDPIGDQHVTVAYLLDRLRPLAPKTFELPKTLAVPNGFDGTYVPRNTTNLAAVTALREDGLFARGVPSLTFETTTAGVHFYPSYDLPLFQTEYPFCRSGETVHLIKDPPSGTTDDCDRHAADYPDLVFRVTGNQLSYTGGYPAFPKAWVRVSDLAYGPVHRHPSLDPDSRPEDYAPPAPRTTPEITTVTIDHKQISEILSAGASREKEEIGPLAPVTHITASSRSVIAVWKDGHARLYAPEGGAGDRPMKVTATVGMILVTCPDRMPYRIVEARDHDFIRSGPQKQDAPKGLARSFIDSLQFSITDKDSGTKVPYQSYRIEVGNGQTIEGISDEDGNTVRVYSCAPADLKLYVD